VEYCLEYSRQFLLWKRKVMLSDLTYLNSVLKNTPECFSVTVVGKVLVLYMYWSYHFQTLTSVI